MCAAENLRGTHSADHMVLSQGQLPAPSWKDAHSGEPQSVTLLWQLPTRISLRVQWFFSLQW